MLREEFKAFSAAYSKYDLLLPSHAESVNCDTISSSPSKSWTMNLFSGLVAMASSSFSSSFLLLPIPIAYVCKEDGLSK